MGGKILFTGDYIISNPTKKDFFSKDIKKVISEHDVICCNFEGPIINEGMKKKIKIGPNINNNVEDAKYLIKNKFNLFCLANNHIFDYGNEGIDNTIKFFEDNNVEYIGAGIKDYDMYKTYKKNMKGVNIEVINVAENGFGAAVEEEYGYAYMFNDRVKELIKKAKLENNYIIVVCHAGAEHWEVPLPELRKVYKSFIDFGANLIIAHHPHIPQGWEEYNNGVIFYSLGNFIFNKGNGFENNKTFAVSITVRDNKEFTYKIIPLVIKDGILYVNNNKEDCDELYNRAKLLNNDNEYLQLINDKSLQYYEKIYKKLYYKVAGIYKGGPKEKAKQIIKKYILREKFQDKVLYHNLNIETHYWIARRASRLIMKQKNII